MYKIRKDIFINYCIKNESWLESHLIPILKTNLHKEAILIEFRELEHLYFLIKTLYLTTSLSRKVNSNT